MKPLDDFIKSNAERFDTGEPLPGHFDRFDERLDRSYGNKRSLQWGLFMRIAAIVLIGMVLTFFAFRASQYVNRDLGYVVTAAAYPDLLEAEEYYSMQTDIYYSKIKNLRFENDKMQKKQILDELSAMDNQVKILKHDLIQNPENERVVNAIINFYQVKLEFMDMIITRTQNTNPTIL